MLPQLESWCSLFVTFDLRRNGVVMFSELEQGLATACSPEVAIMSSSKMVGDVMEAMAFVGKREEIIELITQISNSLNSLAAKYTSGIKFLRGNPHTSRILHDIDQVALALRQTIASRHAEKMLNLDGHLYIFKTSCQALVRWITSYIQANGDGLRLQAYSKNLAALQTHCRTALAAQRAITSGSDTAAELIATLSAPALSNATMLSALRTPPPTVSGIKHCSAVALTMLSSVPRPS